MDIVAVRLQIKQYFMRDSSGPLRSRLWGALERSWTSTLRELKRRNPQRFSVSVFGLADSNGRLIVRVGGEMAQVDRRWVEVLTHEGHPEEVLRSSMWLTKEPDRPMTLGLWAMRHTPSSMVIWQDYARPAGRPPREPAGLRGGDAMSDEERRQLMDRLASLSGRTATTTLDTDGDADDSP